MRPERPEGTCAEVRDAILEGAVTPEVRAHGGSCPACAELLADGEVLGRFLGAPAEAEGADGMAEQVLARLAADRSPVPRLPSIVRMGLVWTAVFLPAAVGVALRPRPDLASYPIDRMVLVLGALWAAGAVAGRVVLRPVHRPLVAARGVWVGVALVLPILVGLLPRIENGFDPPWLASTVQCFVKGAALAAVVLVGLWSSERRSQPGALWWAGASGLAAISGGLVLQLACPATDVAHLVFGHGSVGMVIAMVVVGVLSVREALSVR